MVIQLKQNRITRNKLGLSVNFGVKKNSVKHRQLFLCHRVITVLTLPWLVSVSQKSFVFSVRHNDKTQLKSASKSKARLRPLQVLWKPRLFLSTTEQHDWEQIDVWNRRITKCTCRLSSSIFVLSSSLMKVELMQIRTHARSHAGRQASCCSVLSHNLLSLIFHTYPVP